MICAGSWQGRGKEGQGRQEAVRRMHSLCQLHVADLSYSDVVQGMLRASGMKMPYMFVVPQRTGSMQSKARALEDL